jgi:hypothetical protein
MKEEEERRRLGKKQETEKFSVVIFGEMLLNAQLRDSLIC